MTARAALAAARPVRAASHAADPDAIGAAFRAIASVSDGDLQIVDATLPHGLCAACGDDVTFTARPGLDAERRGFVAGFRQAGGHRELFLSESGRRPFRHVLAGIIERLDCDRPVAIFLERVEDAIPVLELVDGRVSLLIPWKARAASESEAGLDSLLRCGLIALQPRGGDRHLWIVSAERAAPLAEALQAQGLKRQRGGGSPRAAAAFQVAVPEPTDRFTIPAARLIHDGGYRSESDGGYSWLWTGPSPHFRLLLPRTRKPARRTVISIIKSEDERNLDGLRLLVDGRHVPHRRDRWGGVETASIDLPPPRDDMSVLSLVCPHVTPDAGGQRLLGLCIDKVEMLP